MASITEDFNAFVSVDLDSNSNPQPWPAVNSDQLSLHQVSGQVRIRGEAIARNRHPTPLDTINHRASVEFAVFHADDLEAAGPAVRMNATTASFYNIAAGQSFIGVEKFVNGTYNTAFAESFANYVEVSLSPNDRVELRVSGTDPVLLSAYINGSLVTDLGTDGVITDASETRITSGNYVGLFGFSETTDQTLRMDNFAAQDEPSGGGEEITGSAALTGFAVTASGDGVVGRVGSGSLSVVIAQIAGSGTVGVPLTTATVNGVLIDENGDPVEASGITVEMWEDVANPVGAPDQTLTSQSSDSSGDFSWEFTIGGLTGTEDVFVRYIIPADPPTQFGAGVFTPTYG